MSELGIWEPADDRDRRYALGAHGALAAANRAGVLTAADVLVAQRLGRLAGDDDERVLLAVACTVRAVGRGSVCVDLAAVPGWAPDQPWPEVTAWRSAVAASRVVESGALRVEGDLLYLDRYHRLERQLCDDLAARLAAPPPPAWAGLDDALGRAFPAAQSAGDRDLADQRAAAEHAARRWTTVLTGGPGTGKTTSIAGLLAVLLAEAQQTGRRLSIALSAPTGRAAARLQESVAAESQHLPEQIRDLLAASPAVTLHRLLGWRPDNSTRFRHDRTNRLQHDVVVVDEASMVDLTLMARLLEAVRPETRLILVGDPDQLTSVGAGAVLSDLVTGFADRPDSPVVRLEKAHRYGDEIGRLAAALRLGDPDQAAAAALEALRAGGASVEFVEVADDAEVVAALEPLLVAHAAALADLAGAGRAEEALAHLDRHRLICAHREGPRGVGRWNRSVERWLAERDGADYWPHWYAGRPLLVTANDYALGVYNGESGVAVRRSDGSLRGLIQGSGGVHDFATTRLGEVETMHALTVHKSQGGQAEEVTVLLPAAESRLLTRELFYTAVTRARRTVRVVGSEEEVRAAIARRADRATGLSERIAALP